MFPGMRIEDTGLQGILEALVPPDMGDVVAYSIMSELSPPILLGPVVIPTWSN